MTQWDPNYFQKDEEKLKELGYKQQLVRNLGPIQNFGISFSIITVFVSVTTMFSYGLLAGGPATMTISWIVVSFFSCMVALSMAEIVSALPTSGGPYYWAATLAPPKVSRFNLFGLISSNTSLTYGLTQLISNAILVKTDYMVTKSQNIGLCAAILLSWAIMNTVGRPFLRYLLYYSILLNSVGLVVFAIAVLVKAPKYQSASFVFTRFFDFTGPTREDGWSTIASPAYVACIGAYMSLSSFYGYDGSAHLAEETLQAAWTVPVGIITSVVLSALLGFFLLVALLFSIQDTNLFDMLQYKNPVLYILVESFGKNGALALFSLPIMCSWYCGLYLTTSNSRLIWAFSRDHGLPYFFNKVNERFMSPMRAVGLSTCLSFLLCLSSLGSAVAFTAASSMAIMAVLLSYGIPIFLKLIGHGNFCLRKGPFQLGRASYAISFISIVWIMFSCVIVSLPTATPVTKQTLNYGPIGVSIIFILATGGWLLKAQRVFVGPVKNWTPMDISNYMGSAANKT
ncbi:hypothetical protein BP6252_02950 [Coleophoma cylindrospora]|uniref:Uncharacterized protein n=1 Tax=Coleophoma cylindrospora TaxID=1849047 RepID=A0A3D8S6D8_9HELO|nr:hypothetical protein BP6252_02950 [Coleophoma cylindrospora]